MLNRFDLFGLCPAALPQASLAAAVARAGGSGVLDLQYGVDAELAALRWSQLLACTEARIGLRCAPEQAAMVASLLMPQRDRAFDLMLAAAAAAEQAAAITLLRAAHPGLRIWVEITDAEAFVALDHAVDGYIALGHEAGGWVGEDTSFILLQKLHGRSARPLLLRGGIGLRAAAACRVAGAAGVVLDDVLLLLRESALPVDAQAALARLNGVECKLLGEALGQNCRVYAPPASAALKTAEAEDRDAEGGQLERAEWRRRSQARLGWALKEQLLPLGQGIGLAATYRDQFGTVAALMQAMRRDSARAVNQARDLAFLDEGGPLAASHGTRFPLVQGPMTRVSDVPDFAVEVAKSGALPLLALALLRGPQVREMLEQTRDRIGDRPWGVGMLGFVPQALREEQCAEIWKCPPPFALIAGGRPDQAAAFEARGIQTYIHAPAPALLRLYLEQGARRFVFEGRECGGHVGPLASFALWEQMIEVLLTEVPKGAEKDVHVLFAGGIHDALSCAMVAAITAPLAARGMKVGALMGTAYLFTREIVATGAIVQGFQDEALRCQRTVNLETGPGHASRCVDTAFAREFFETRKQLIREGRSAEEIRDALEDLNLGRLRIASKGLNRSADGQIVQIDPQRQLAEGMYMIGQVATLRAEPVRLEDLHLDVCRGAQLQLEAVAAPRPERAAPQPSDIAIVGIGTLLPKADGPDAYWHNILHQVRTIGPVPPKRWDPELYFDPDRKTRDKVYSRWGGFLDEVPFDPMRYGIPPKSMKSIDPMQLLTLEVAQRTLADAGYGDGQFDRENTSIILGAGGGLGDLGLQYGVRAELPRFVENPDPRVWERLPEWTEESFAGTLLNVAAGRVANRMDFGGVNFTVDAACGSSLAAITLAVQELETGRSNVVLAGGIDTVQSPFGFLCFSKTQALSPDGDPRTFDQSANGIAISEGLAVVALKRLADAERDGDRIYAVIKACAGSSDGKALGLTAPRPDGQIRALHRAYAKAGFSPATLELFEAHGTGTPVGDRAEAETVTRALQAEHAAPKSVVLGSVKTLIGHTKASAGVAGLIKIALSLYHRVQPAHYGVKAPIAPLAGDAAPACLLQAPRPWVAHPEHPRRAGVSAFGFGGTNFHAVLEEYTGFGGGGGEAAAGHRHWPVELMLFRARDAADLQQQIDRLLPSLVAPGRLDLSSLSFALAREAARRGEQPLSLALVASQFKSFATDLQNVRAHLVDGTALPPGLRLNRQTVVRQEGLAFLFPGQGAQYPQMGREVALYCEELRQSLEQADRVLQGRLPRRLSQYILPPAAFDAATEQAQAAALTDTRVAQPAIGAVALGYLALAERLGLDARATAGHSYGEYVALCAAGALEREDCLQLSAVRGAAMADAARLTAPGSMAAVQAARAAVEAAIAGLDGVQVANHNAPQQTVISGAVDAVATALERLGTAGHRVVKLPVSGAFHTPLVAPARAPLSAAIAATTFRTPRRAVYSNRSGAAYPADPATLKAELDEHLLSSVEFVREITALYEAGCRTFIELGPKSLCTNMAKAILEGRDGVLCVALDGQGGGLKGLLLGLAELWTQGVAFDPLRLFDGRRLDRLDLAQLARAAAVAPLPAHTWMISGGCARPLDDPQRRTGRLPALTQRDVESARAAAAAEKAQAAPAAPLAAPAPAATAASATPAAGSAAPLWNGPALAAYQQTMQQFLALQERVMQQAFGLAPATAAMPLPAVPSVATVAPPPTAAMVPVSLAAPAPAAALPSTPPATTVATAVAPPAQVRVVPPRPSPTPTIDWRQTLLDLVAERTGYPPDMLALDADLEADLGVDSIKRVEILGALQKALPGEAGSAVQAQMERFTQARSLQAILDTLAELTSSLPQGGREAGREGRAQQGTGLSDTTATSAAPTPSPAPAGHPLPLAGEGIKNLLLDLVAERTGYPPEMLALDADLEADLGVDSIKRVEILGALQKALPGDAGGAVKAQMERFTQARSLQAILDTLAELTSSLPQGGREAGREGRAQHGTGLSDTTATSATPTPSPAPAGHPLPLAGEGINTLLLDLVAERTGYPPEMLALDADLEADLGVDSIKRVEILGALQKALPADAGEAVKAQMERFTQARSLQAILDALAGIAKPEASVVTRTVPTSAAPPSEAPSPAPTPRYVLHPVPAPLPPTPKTLEGTVLLLGGPASVQEPLSAALKARGLQPLSLPTEDARALRATLEQAASARSPITGLLHLSGLEFGEPADLGDWRTGYHVHLLTLLHALQALGPAAASLRLRVASRLGGSFGRASIGHGPVLAGGLNGMLNCLRHEYPQMSARAVDFDGQTDEWIAEALLRELAVDDVHPEVGYLGEERLASETRLSPLTESPFPPHPEPDGDWVVLATGGARGITAEILIGLARPGMRLVLVGRTPEPAAESAEHAAAPTPAALRALLLAEARAQGVAVKPVEVERQLQRRLAEREIRDSLARLRAVGATVDYISCDVRDEAALRGLLHGLYERHGRIDAVLHGAGVIEDKRLPDKTPDSFERVLGTKLDAAYVLAQALQPASLKLLCFFTSVAGRYGNQGQSDYAAANEVLNRLAWTLHRRWPETRVMAINWGPWDAGMASEGVKAQFRAQGIEPIPIASGVRFFLEELARGPRKDVELVAGRGTWGVEAVPPPPSEAPPADLPLIRQAPRMGPGGAMTVDHVFTAQSDPYLLDHRIDGKLVLPAAGAAEWMAQMAAAAWPGWQVSEIRDLRQFNGISLEVDGERAIQLRARSSTHSDAGTQSITVEMVDPGQKRPCYRATVCLSQQLEPAPTMSVSALDGALAVPVAEAYGRYLFHGPRFHLLRSVDGVALAGGDATVSRSRVADWLGREGRWLFDPGLLDLPPQLAIVWSRSQHDMTALPSGFGRIQRYAGADLSQPLRLHLRLQDGSGTTLRYDAWLLDAQGRVHLAIENAEGAMSAALNRLAENRAHEHG
jgi:acyl transferase domain-containing protein/NAD(P)-dependent dehydrogenase (short-subunit alcohol dehydrogenase family)